MHAGERRTQGESRGRFGGAAAVRRAGSGRSGR